MVVAVLLGRLLRFRLSILAVFEVGIEASMPLGWQRSCQTLLVFEATGSDCQLSARHSQTAIKSLSVVKLATMGKVTASSRPMELSVEQQKTANLAICWRAL
jgi:hypothetical protein